MTLNSIVDADKQDDTRTSKHDFISVNENHDVTDVTNVTARNGAGYSGYTPKNHDVTYVTNRIVRWGENELKQPPCYLVVDEWFSIPGIEGNKRPGVYWCYELAGKGDKPSQNVALFVCSPLHIVGTTNTYDQQYYGRLLEFIDPRGKRRRWAMPMEMVRGSCEELRGQLLASGVTINPDAQKFIPKYIQYTQPETYWSAATRTGWTPDLQAFVFTDRVIGDAKVHYQSEFIASNDVARVGGDFEKWFEMSKLAKNNPILILSLCVPLAGAILGLLGRDSIGIHLYGDSTTGKTTAMRFGASIYGGVDFSRTWMSTANGLEGAAAQLSDTCLCLDEINNANGAEIGSVIYALGNGTGKSRANRIGSARNVNRWRLTIFSTGERTIASAMAESGKQIKAGQILRFLNVPVIGEHGIFDDLHNFGSGSELSEHIRETVAVHYGHAGVKFIRYLIEKRKGTHETFAEVLSKFETEEPQLKRAAAGFALFGMAGEIAIEAGIIGLDVGDALSACQTAFNNWLGAHGATKTEHDQILNNVRDFIQKYGDTKFTDKDIRHEQPKGERAGWYTSFNDEKTYLFIPAAIKQAGGNYDMTRILNALDSAGWIKDKDPKVKSKVTYIPSTGKQRLYWIKPGDDGNA